MIKTENERPGVMLYFDSLRPAINRMSDAECGVLLRAIIDYAEYGLVSELDALAGMAFDMLRPRIDRDAERYEETREQRQYATYCREAKKRAEQPMTLGEWRLKQLASTSNATGDHETARVISGDHQPSPTATASTTSTPAATSSGSPTASSPKNTFSSKNIGVSINPSASGEGDGGEGNGDVRQAYADWLDAMDAKDMSRAMLHDSRLARLGYNVDRHTRKLTRRVRDGTGIPI